MGLRSWWKTYRERRRLNRQSLAWNDDQGLIATQVPELAGMSDVESMAYILQQIDAWKATCSPDEASEFARRGHASIETFERDGLTMPYWATLWILRTYQKSLGLDVPHVAPARQNSN